MTVGLDTNTIERVGLLTASLANLAKLVGCSYSSAPIFIGPSNIQHIESKHTYDFDNYFAYLQDIIASPDYIGIQPDDGSLRLVKRLSEHVMVLVRITKTGKLFVRSLYCIKEDKLQSYIESGSMVRVV